MNKKAQMKFVIGLAIVVVIILVASPLIGRTVTTSNSIADEVILQKIQDQNEREKALEDKIDGFPPVKFSGSITEESIEFGEDFLEFIFHHDFKTYNTTKGFLMSYKAPPRIETKYWTLVLVKSKGISAVYTDGVYRELLASAKSKPYLRYADICVLPLEDDGLEAAKVMSYATGIPHDKLTSIPDVEEVNNIISNNKVEQLSFAIGGNKPTLKYFKGSDFTSVKIAGDDEKIVMFYKEGTVCFFPVDISYNPFSSGHVDFDTKNGKEILEGKGFLFKDFNQHLLSKTQLSKNIKKVIS